MFKQISVALMLSLAAMAQANDHENPSTTDGAFITMMVQSDDPMSYISALQSNSPPLKPRAQPMQAIV